METLFVLTVAAAESSACSGLLADLRTFGRLGVRGAGVVTAVGTENPEGFVLVHEIPTQAVREQLRAARAAGPIRAAKVGFVTTVPVIRAAAAEVSRLGAPVVVDPALVTRSGTPLLRGSSTGAFVRELLPVATVITPNLPEASLLAGFPVRNEDGAKRAARAIQQLGPRAVLIKGGHAEGDEVADGLLDGRTWCTLRHPRLPVERPEGSGGLLSAAITAFLARGETLPDAVAAALDFVHRELAAWSM
ncbi:MAG TPA: hydroxymethylpyrimidine/phosphomethylpyrimidine kinase [Thermoanaerobaculia bacterium]|nr:hydroxymethylpyrimidine/phosphomethylpyrimidine kinase [Thermoanaerobaculia bacterium]